MSFNVTHEGPARDVDGRHEQAADAARPNRNVFEERALDAGKAFVELVTRHCGNTDHTARVESYGHFDGLGLGYVSIKVTVFPTVPPAPEAPKGEGE